MQVIKINELSEALRRIPVVLMDAGTGLSPQLGVVPAANELMIIKRGGSPAPWAGSWMEVGGGDYFYSPAVGEVDTYGYLEGRIVITGIRTYRFLVQIVGYDWTKPWVPNVAGTPLAAVPAAAATPEQQMMWVYQASSDPIIEDGTTHTLRNRGDTADIATRSHATTGSVYTTGAWTSGP